MSHHLSRTSTVVVALVAPLLLAAPQATADRGDDDEVIREGSCSAGTDWKVKAKTDDGRLEFEGEIDSNRVGQTWTWRIKHNETTSARGTSTTTGRSGSFDVERKLTNLAGTDQFVFRARNPATGEVCRGALAF
ncbi:MAG: hypothetical protein ACR2JD_09035 [Nocardioides sp.]